MGIHTALFFISAMLTHSLTSGTIWTDSTRDGQWHLRSLNAAQAHEISRGAGIVVAVVDTGVDRHPDLQANLLSGASVLKSRLDNGQGDPNGHGTLMASLIAAKGRDNEVGVLGLAPDARILPIRDSDADGQGNSVRAAEAIELAISQGATIVNFSRAVAPSLALKKAVARAAAADVLIVASSGNKGQDVVAAYPAAMDGVLAVGASDKSDKPASFTKPGPQVQVCAPGVDIVGAMPGSRYSIGDGTSQATAIVSGAAALLKSHYPDMSNRDVIKRITNTATDIGKPGRDDECGYGLLNIVKALTAEVPPPTGSTPVTPTSATPAVAAPTPDSKGSNIPAVAAGIAATAALTGAVLTFVLIRKRRRP